MLLSARRDEGGNLRAQSLTLRDALQVFVE